MLITKEHIFSALLFLTLACDVNAVKSKYQKSILTQSPRLIKSDRIRAFFNMLHLARPSLIKSAERLTHEEKSSKVLHSKHHQEYERKINVTASVVEAIVCEEQPDGTVILNCITHDQENRYFPGFDYHK